MDWKEEPASNQQLLLLQQYGFVPTCPLTVTQAARLIRQYSKRPVSAAPKQSGPGSAAARAAPVQPGLPLQAHIQAEALSQAARTHVYNLRLAVLAAAHTLKENPDRPGVRADLHATLAARQQFWWDTCRDHREMVGASEHAQEFCRHFGARFFTPPWEAVQEVLDALDGAVPGWDKNHPELFYETLKLNFPSLLRQN